jgi:flagellar hook-basal body complex protein FliE
MSVEILLAIAPHDEVAPPFPLATAPASNTGTSFPDRVFAGIEALNRQLLATQGDLQRLAVGEAPNLHEVVIRLEESRTALQLMLQVRSRVLEAYQDVMRMQV